VAPLSSPLPLASLFILLSLAGCLPPFPHAGHRFLLRCLGFLVRIKPPLCLHWNVTIIIGFWRSHYFFLGIRNVDFATLNLSCLQRKEH
jgi:hypothetical protein